MIVNKTVIRNSLFVVAESVKNINKIFIQV